MTRTLWTLLLLACLACSGESSPEPDSTVDAVEVADTVVHQDLSGPDLADTMVPEDVPGELVDLISPLDLVDALPEVEVEVEEVMDLVAEEVEEVVEVDIEPPPEPVDPLPVARSDWGGYLALKLTDGSGFFSTSVTDDRVWLVDPEGYAFFSLGLQAVSTGSLNAPALGYAPGKLAQWSKWAAELGAWSPISATRLKEHMAAMLEHGFNTVGGWSGGYGNLSGNGIAYSVSLGFAGGVQGAIADKPIPKVSTGNMPDVFHPDFPAACLAYAQGHVSATQAEDPWNLGYYSDNELRWWGKDYFIESGTWTLADDYIDESAESPGKQAFVALMAERYDNDVAAFNEAYGTDLAEFDELHAVTQLAYDKEDAAQMADRMAFIEAIAERYFSEVQGALKSVAPNHLYLCVRFASVAPQPVIEMAAKYCDVVTFNDYYILPDPISEMALGGTPEARWASYGAIVTAADPPKPIIVTEWGMRADDSGLPNTFGAGFVVDTQRERADFYRFSADWFSGHVANGLGFVGGWHWFMYIDEPPTGRFDGEDGNYGVVTLRDEKYHFLWQAMAAVNVWVDNWLVEVIRPSLLPPPATVEAVAEAGVVKIAWDAVPLAEGYEVTVMTHPAGTEERLVESLATGETEVVVDLNKHGMGTFWLAVSATHESLLSMGPRVSEAVVVEWDDPPPQLADVLACEYLETVRFHNSVPLPNDEQGQTYVASTPSFIDGEGAALRLEFLPSSLGYIMLSPSGDTTLVVEVGLPDAVSVDQASSLTFQMVPHHLVRTDQSIVPASDFLWVAVVNADDDVLGQVDLSTVDAVTGEAATVVVPLTVAGDATVIRFEVDLFAQYLPLESLLVVDIDQFTFTAP